MTDNDNDDGCRDDLIISAKEDYVIVVVCLSVSNFAQKLPTNGFA